MMKLVKIISLVFILNLVLTACVKNNKTKGFYFVKSNFALVKEQINNKQDALNILGSPSSVSSFGGETWYYISSKEESVAFFNPKLIEQYVIALKFDNNDNLSDIKQYDLKDGVEIEFKEDFTHTGGDKRGVIKNMINNMGRFNNNSRKTGVKKGY
ncbi:MAG: outer membrane protein assembly factor BamE [Alphaproteobacteria bacterium]